MYKMTFYVSYGCIYRRDYEITPLNKEIKWVAKKIKKIICPDCKEHLKGDNLDLYDSPIRQRTEQNKRNRWHRRHAETHVFRCECIGKRVGFDILKTQWDNLKPILEVIQ